MARDAGIRLDNIILFCLNAGRRRVLAVAGLIIAVIAFADWQVGLDISLGALYVIPMLLAALVLRTRSIIGLALFCAMLRRLFERPHLGMESVLRFAFGIFAYISAGLFVSAVMQSRREQALRIEAQEQLKTLVDSSPAGILTLDDHGIVVAANSAVGDLFGLAGETIKGRNIAAYLPVLADALRLDTGAKPFRTSAQAQGRRESGEIFLADIWFSTYPTPKGTRLAAIVIDSSEEMRNREEQSLRQLSLNSRIMAGAILHEVRNLCSAISALYANLRDTCPTVQSVELQGLDHLVEGLARVAALELHPYETAPIETVSVKEVLSELRIIVEPAWNDAGGSIRWEVPNDQLRVFADRHGLLQVFLNLVQNSQRAVQNCPVQELAVSASTAGDKIRVRFRDSGVGVPSPEILFQPFQSGVSSTGLGLYISRSLLRSYGGDLRFEPQEHGAAFVSELVRVAHRTNR